MKKALNSTKAPGAIGPYSQGIEIPLKMVGGESSCGSLVFVSGQLPIDVETGEMPDDIRKQTRRSLENIKAILEEAGGTMDNVVKSTVFLADMSLFGPMNEVYGEFFKDGVFPARAAFAVKELPKQALVEIEVIAFV